MSNRKATRQPRAGQKRAASGGVAEKKPNPSTLRSQHHLKQMIEVNGGQRFVVMLRGGEECDALNQLLAEGFGKTKVDVVRTALLKAAGALKRGGK